MVCVTANGKPIKAKTVGQKAYLDAIRNNSITLGVGPAGTGKTYLAVAMAVAAFRAREVNRIILTARRWRPGSGWASCPATCRGKVDPYLRPLYDALFEMLGPETYQKYVERGQHRGGPPGLYAGAHPGRQLHHPGRGPEHLPGADEDVFDPAGLRLPGGHHRRHHPDRPAPGYRCPD